MDIQKLTIIPDDEMVIVDNYPLTMPVTLPENIHAVQYLAGAGEIEYNDGTFNAQFTDLTPYSDLISEHAKRKHDELNPHPPELTEPEKFAALISERDQRLQAMDWLMLRHTDETALYITTSLSEDRFVDVLNYRQQLRELPQKYKTSKEWQWPALPEWMREATE